MSNGSAKLTIHLDGAQHQGGGSGSAKAISAKAAERLALVKKRYPDPKSAVMTALYLAQEELGYINQTALEWVSAQLDMPLIHVQEVATFYTMYYKRPVGKYHFQHTIKVGFPCVVQ